MRFFFFFFYYYLFIYFVIIMCRNREQEFSGDVQEQGTTFVSVFGGLRNTNRYHTQSRTMSI